MPAQDDEFLTRLRATFQVEADEHLAAIAAEFFALHGQFDSLALGQRWSAMNQSAQDAVFRSQILDLQAELLIDVAPHPSQQFSPAHLTASHEPKTLRK